MKTMKTATLLISMIFAFLNLYSQSQVGCKTFGFGSGDLFGHSVSLSSNGIRLVVGASNNNNGRGQVSLYEWDGSNWNLVGNQILGQASFDLSGFSVSISSNGDRFVTGAPGNDNSGISAGNARIYEWDGSSNNQLGGDINGETDFDNSGISVSLSSSGNRVAIGANLNDGNGSNAGHVRVYEWDGAIWNQLGSDIDGENAGDESGRAVSLSSSGDRVAIGANLNDGNGADAGHVRVYEWNGTIWNQLGSDIDGENAGDESGRAVSLSSSGDRVAIGANMNDGNGADAGHVRVYEWNGTIWNQLGSDIDGENAGDESGRAVSLSSSGDRIVIGAPLNDGIGSDAGHARIYDWDGVSWNQFELDIEGDLVGSQTGYSTSISSDGSKVGIGSPTFGAGYFSVFESTVTGKALHFDGRVGNYDYVNIPDDNSLDFTNGFTFETWVKFNQVSRTTHSYDWQAFFAKPSYAGAYGMMLLTEGSKYLRFYHSGLSVSETSYPWTTVAADTWYHVAVTYNGSFVRMYIDGVEVMSAARTGSIDVNSETLHLGASFGGNPPYPLDGALDEIRFWNRALSINEIQQYKDCELIGTENGLVAYYQTNQGIANGNNISTSMLLDLTSNQNDGTLNNFELYGCASNWISPGGVIPGTACVPLPVELINFYGRLLNKQIELKWITASELNNLGFEIQKSNNGIDWQIIDFVDGRGTTSEVNEYNYIDTNPFSGINYYRLKQLDYDGAFEFSKVIAIEYKSPEKEIQVFPNPSNKFINIQIGNLANQRMRVEITDNLGRKIWESGLIEGESNWRKEMGIEQNGIYFISAQIGDEVFYKRVLINGEK